MKKTKNGSLTTRMWTYVAVGVLVFGVPSSASSESKSKLGRTMWSAFQCATYAELSGQSQEQARLFPLGYQSGLEFILAVQAGDVSPAQLRSDVPVMVGLLLQGPTPDFMVGRVFEAAMRDAYDKVIKRDAAGQPITDPSNWVTNDDVKSAIASRAYTQANCSIVGQ